LILELAASPTVTQLNIVTLNHDTLVEQLLASGGVPVIDGFGAADGDVRWYDDECYDTPDGKVRLYKLHGSIDWYEFLRSGGPCRAVLRGSTPHEAHDASGALLTPTLRLPSFLAGGSKEAWYQHGHYADIHFRFHELLRRCDRMVMSGYGWGDTG